MLKCICCKNHVHIVLGDEENIRERHPTQFGWPLYSQDVVRFAEKDLIEREMESEEDRQDVRNCFARIYPRINQQGHDTRGRFTKPFLPKNMYYFPIDYVSLLTNWMEFVEGKTKKCEYIQHLLPGPYMVPVRNCSLMRYITEPPRQLQRFESLVWEAVFDFSEDLEVI